MNGRSPSFYQRIDSHVGQRLLARERKEGAGERTSALGSSPQGLLTTDLQPCISRRISRRSFSCSLAYRRSVSLQISLCRASLLRCASFTYTATRRQLSVLMPVPLPALHILLMISSPAVAIEWHATYSVPITDARTQHPTMHVLAERGVTPRQMGYFKAGKQDAEEESFMSGAAC